MDDKLVAAVFTLVGVVFATLVQVAFQFYRDRKQKEEAFRIERIAFEYDNDRTRASFMAERVARDLLSYPKANYRTFRIMRHHIGGFGDDELRQILVRAGAIRTYVENWP
jgi:hypothetical protein